VSHFSTIADWPAFTPPISSSSFIEVAFSWRAIFRYCRDSQPLLAAFASRFLGQVPAYAPFQSTPSRPPPPFQLAFSFHWRLAGRYAIFFAFCFDFPLFSKYADSWLLGLLRMAGFSLMSHYADASYCWWLLAIAMSWSYAYFRFSYFQLRHYCHCHFSFFNSCYSFHFFQLTLLTLLTWQLLSPLDYQIFSRITLAFTIAITTRLANRAAIAFSLLLPQYFHCIKYTSQPYFFQLQVIIEGTIIYTLHAGCSHILHWLYD